jgi:methyl-accepting chemotaxis protein
VALNLVNEVGTSLGEMLKQVRNVRDIVVDIAGASQEQAAGIEQVNKAVLQMDQMTQENAALVEAGRSDQPHANGQSGADSAVPGRVLPHGKTQHQYVQQAAAAATQHPRRAIGSNLRR